MAGQTRAVLRAAAVTCLTIYATSVGWTLLPALAGWQATVVTSGSMAPGIQPGDVVVYSPAKAEDLTIGRVVVFEDPTRPGRLLTHRIVGVRPDRSVVTKGDANRTDDSDPIPAARVRGMGRLLVPYVGRVALLRTQHWAKAVELLVGLLVVAGCALAPPAQEHRRVRTLESRPVRSARLRRR